jgi:hypothetical protein
MGTHLNETTKVGGRLYIQLPGESLAEALAGGAYATTQELLLEANAQLPTGLVFKILDAQLRVVCEETVGEDCPCQLLS